MHHPGSSAKQPLLFRAIDAWISTCYIRAGYASHQRWLLINGAVVFQVTRRTQQLRVKHQARPRSRVLFCTSLAHHGGPP